MDKETIFNQSITRVAQLLNILDNYYRLRTLKLLEKKSYYITELQKELGIKVYKSMHDSLKVLEQSKLIIKEKQHNTAGRQVKISLNKEVYNQPANKMVILMLYNKHNIK